MAEQPQQQFITGKLLRKKIFYIDSENRLSGSNTSFQYKIDLDNETYKRVSLLQCSIPKSWYLVPADGNSFTLDEGGTQVAVSLTAGNYDPTNFMAVLPTLLNNASPNGWTYTMTFPNSSTEVHTGKFTFSVSGNGGVQPAFIFGSARLCRLFGFDKNSTNTFVADSLTSSNMVNFNTKDTIYLNSDMCKEDNRLQEIFVSSVPNFSTIKYENHDIEFNSKTIQSDKSNIYSFKITDEDGYLLDTNGLNSVFSIVVYTTEPN